MSMAPQLLRLAQVMERTALSRSTIYDRMRRGAFPQPVRIGIRCIRWRAADIDEWIG